VQTIAIFDTEPIVIEGVRRLLESREGVRVVAAQLSLAEAIDIVREFHPSVVLVDRAFGIRAVMDLLKTVREVSGAKTGVILWSGAITESEALRFLQAGAMGVVRKTAPLEMLLRCIDTVHSGSTWMEDQILQSVARPIRMARSPLTARELQVMELVEQGLKNKDIAVNLGIRTGTVKIHLKHIFEKTGIRGRYGLALSGLKEKGLLSVSTIEAV
jgi:two-component system, NarL family, nitrate/nitrite response regulator NarL